MPLRGHICSRPRDLLTADEIGQIHDSTLRVLDEVGVVFGSDQALRTLQQSGARVDPVSGRVHLPPELVQECIERCPAQFTIRARNPDFDLAVGADRLYFQSHPGLYLVDLETGDRREATLRDIGPMVRLLDALEEIHLPIMPTGTVSDRPPPVMVESVTAEVMRHTQKVTAAGVFDGCAPWIIEMAAVTNQQVYGQINPVSPLQYSREQIEGGLQYVAAGHPICILPGLTLGANSPATLAGTLVLQNAEQLAGVVLVQLFRPGAPVTLASYPHIMDMRHGAVCIGGVEIGLLGAALAQIGRHYAIPSHPEFPMSDSKALDEQAALEKAMSAVLVAEAGASLVSNGGALEAEKAWSPVQLVIDNEINAMVGRILEGITVTDRTLAVDVIREVACAGGLRAGMPGSAPTREPAGNFLRTVHTKRTWRQEQYLPRLADRLGYETWKAQGARDMVARAREQALHIVRSHEVPPLPEEQDRELRRLLAAAERAKLGSLG